MTTPITTVSVCFQADLLKENPRTYTYKVPLALAEVALPCALAVVFVRDRFECVSIIGINPPLDPNAKFEYKYIIDVVERHSPTQPSADS